MTTVRNSNQPKQPPQAYSFFTFPTLPYIEVCEEPLSAHPWARKVVGYLSMQVWSQLYADTNEPHNYKCEILNEGADEMRLNVQKDGASFSYPMITIESLEGTLEENNAKNQIH